MLIHIGDRAIPAQESAGSPLSFNKQSVLFERLGALGSVIVAFSGGTDSAYLAWAAQQALGDNAVAITAISPSFSAYDREQATEFARQNGLRHEFVETREFENPLYIANQPDRCYHCKVELFAKLAQLRAARATGAIAYGMNLDDLRDFRPGHRQHPNTEFSRRCSTPDC